MLNVEQNRLTLELVFQEESGTVRRSNRDSGTWRSLSPDEQISLPIRLGNTVTDCLIRSPPSPSGLRDYLLGLGIRQGLIIPLASGRQNARFSSVVFQRGTDFDQEELEIARALVTQAALAIHLTRLAKRADNLPFWGAQSDWPGDSRFTRAELLPGFLQLFAAQEVIQNQSTTMASAISNEQTIWRASV